MGFDLLLLQISTMCVIFLSRYRVAIGITIGGGGLSRRSDEVAGVRFSPQRLNQEKKRRRKKHGVK